ncbi:MAG: 50S ribosomal protein L30 [Thaumarchaeota archaeon 13_1_40CM_3_50_5]|nr:MAG: 50S ribosomal protein L30 [Thaumarchaeota archaeon 13_1_40CM_4_48_7]OLC26193.1 MAG: 50S ribosomal protein L30 [Candidatus Nitrososphaera sp. 13_1_40CM_48_12]OLC85098.1 MAG: 50S ribosomal protein L30 [Thaumarchaeota archaeon 13_1_40CM_3_50_5]
MAYLVVRIKGTVNIPRWAQATLGCLNLDKRFRATVVPESEQYLGMLRRVKDEVAWTKADAGIVKELLEKRGRKTGYKPITKSDLPKEYKGMDDLAAAIAENKVAITKLEGIKPWFALSPPKGGFKRKTKTQYAQNGVLGEDDELVEIVKRML